MAVYIIAQIQINDRDEYGKYEAGFLEIFSKSPGEILVVSEDPIILEGDWPYTRTVVVKFPSAEDAMSWYKSDEYQALAQHRFRASSGNIIMVDQLALSA
jgi:uncharacterized protein (DUF1330 family)